MTPESEESELWADLCKASEEHQRKKNSKPAKPVITQADLQEFQRRVENYHKAQTEYFQITKWLRSMVRKGWVKYGSTRYTRKVFDPIIESGPLTITWDEVRFKVFSQRPRISAEQIATSWRDKGPQDPK